MVKEKGLRKIEPAKAFLYWWRCDLQDTYSTVKDLEDNILYNSVYFPAMLVTDGFFFLATKLIHLYHRADQNKDILLKALQAGIIVPALRDYKEGDTTPIRTLWEGEKGNQGVYDLKDPEANQFIHAVDRSLCPLTHSKLHIENSKYINPTYCKWKKIMGKEYYKNFNVVFRSDRYGENGAFWDNRVWRSKEDIQKKVTKVIFETVPRYLCKDRNLRRGDVMNALGQEIRGNEKVVDLMQDLILDPKNDRPDACLLKTTNIINTVYEHVHSRVHNTVPQFFDGYDEGTFQYLDEGAEFGEDIGLSEAIRKFNEKKKEVIVPTLEGLWKLPYDYIIHCRNTQGQEYFKALYQFREAVHSHEDIDKAAENMCAAFIPYTQCLTRKLGDKYTVSTGLRVLLDISSGTVSAVTLALLGMDILSLQGPTPLVNTAQVVDLTLKAGGVLALRKLAVACIEFALKERYEWTTYKNLRELPRFLRAHGRDSWRHRGKT